MPPGKRAPMRRRHPATERRAEQGGIASIVARDIGRTMRHRMRGSEAPSTWAPQSAWELTGRWPRGELRMVGLAGHALSEPGISAELVRATDGIVRQASAFGF